jgi:hypothetical protein
MSESQFDAADIDSPDDSAELTTVPVRLDSKSAKSIHHLAQLCGLTADQMASAIVVLAFHRVLKNTVIPKEAR